MLNIQFIQKIAKKIKYTSPFLIFAFVSIFLSIIFALYSQRQTTNSVIKRISYNTPISNPTKTLTPQITAFIIPTVKKTLNQPLPTVYPANTPTIFQQKTHSTSQNPSVMPTTVQPTQVQKPTVNLQIIEPDGTSNFSVTLNSGNNLCENLIEARNEGKIKSLTLDNSYMSTMHSSYVREINGYNNNWTVSVNGNTPQGCTLYSPNPGDTVVWKFG